jgi:hypothetical protein
LTYSNDSYGMLLQIGDLAGAPDTYPHDRYGQILRIADAVGADGAYSGDQQGQLRRIGDGISAPDTYPHDVYGQVLRIADKIGGAGGGGLPGDMYNQLSRIVSLGGLAGIRLSGTTFTAGSAQGTAIGTLSVVGGTGTYTFTLTDSASNKVQVAGTNGVSLQAGATSSSAGSFSITVHADNGAGSTFDRTFLITVTASTNDLLADTGQPIFSTGTTPILVE